MFGIRTSSSTRSGFLARHEREHLHPGLRLTDDLEVPVRLERTADPVEDEPMVVGYDHSHAQPSGRGVATAPPAPPSHEGLPSPIGFIE